MITIVDYGMGNLGSILNMFRRIGVDAEITCDITVIERAGKILLPGVGSFDAAMANISQRNLREILDYKAVQERVPILGICLGMQLLTCSSEEGILPGFGWISATTHRFPSIPGLKIPHMGWNVVTPTQNNPLTEGLPPDTRFYFVHSYYVKVDDEQDSILKTHYGLTFDAAISHGNIYGAQFHPEKSHKFGMSLLANFARL